MGRRFSTTGMNFGGASEGEKSRGQRPRWLAPLLRLTVRPPTESESRMFRFSDYPDAWHGRIEAMKVIAGLCIIPIGVGTSVAATALVNCSGAIKESQ